MGEWFGNAWVVCEARAEAKETVEHQACNTELAALG